MAYIQIFPVHTQHAAPPHPFVFGDHIRQALLHFWIHYWPRLLAGALGLAFLMIAAQLLYPTNRALPSAKIGHYSISMGAQADIERVLQTMQNQPIIIKTAVNSYPVAPADIGMEIDMTASVERIADYPLRDRLIPFSLFFNGHDERIDQLVVRTDEAKLSAFIQKLVSENTKAPVEGDVSLNGVTVNVKLPEEGATYDAVVVTKVLSGHAVFLESPLTMPATPLPPTYNRAVLETAANEARDMLKQAVTVTTLGREQKFEPADIAKWLKFTPEASAKTLQVTFDRDRINRDLQEHVGQVHVAPGWTATNDGVLVRAPGAAGQTLARSETVEAITTALASHVSSLNGLVTQLPLSNGVYPATSAGLQNLVDDWYDKNAWATWGVTVRELGGHQRYAAINQHEPFVTASVYKLFLSYGALTKVDNGSLNPNAPTETGSSVDVCMTYSIVRSSNECSHALGIIVGWDNVTAMLRERGITETTLGQSKGFYTTANDTTEILEELYYGELMNPAPSARLIDMMKRQIYRNGIPTGSWPSTVANKVGYVDGWRHDVGIVYHPKGAYIISALSYGGTYPQIVDLSRRVHDYMSQ